jgi:hypothetical protein
VAVAIVGLGDEGLQVAGTARTCRRCVAGHATSFSGRLHLHRRLIEHAGALVSWARRARSI